MLNRDPAFVSSGISTGLKLVANTGKLLLTSSTLILTILTARMLSLFKFFDKPTCYIIKLVYMNFFIVSYVYIFCYKSFNNLRISNHFKILHNHVLTYFFIHFFHLVLYEIFKVPILLYHLI